MLSLSRNLGLVTGASVMGAVFALGAATIGIMAARPEAVAAGMPATFAVAAALTDAALAIAMMARARRAGIAGRRVRRLRVYFSRLKAFIRR